jgi:hypothetical protein
MDETCKTYQQGMKNMSDRIHIEDWEWDFLERHLPPKLVEAFDILWAAGDTYLTKKEVEEIVGRCFASNTWSSTTRDLGYNLARYNLGLYVHAKRGAGSKLLRHKILRRQEGDAETW